MDDLWVIHNSMTREGKPSLPGELLVLINSAGSLTIRGQEGFATMAW